MFWPSYHSIDCTCTSCSLADSPLPKSKRALLKWKMSTITPNVVKICIARVGFSECTSKKTVNPIPRLKFLSPPSAPLSTALPPLSLLLFSLLFPPSSIPGSLLVQCSKSAHFYSEKTGGDGLETWRRLLTVSLITIQHD